MLKIYKLFAVTLITAGTVAYAGNPVYEDTQSNGTYTVRQTCQVTADANTEDGPLAEYNATVYDAEGRSVGTTKYELAVGAFCYENFKNINAQAFKNLM